MVEQHSVGAGPGWKTRFFSIWSGQQISLVGSSLAQFALVWWLTDTTGSATVLASGMLVSLLPTVFVGPFAGALVDRWDRRRVMIIADGFIALVMKCKSDIAENAELFHVELLGSINCDALMENALRLYRKEAMETALDLDSLTAIMDHEVGRT